MNFFVYPIMLSLSSESFAWFFFTSSLLVQFVQQRNNRFGVLSPENYHFALSERDVRRLLIERVVPNAIPGLQAVDEPLGKERRNIRRAARRDNHGSHSLNGLAGGEGQCVLSCSQKDYSEGGRFDKSSIKSSLNVFEKSST